MIREMKLLHVMDFTLCWCFLYAARMGSELGVDIELLLIYIYIYIYIYICICWPE